jgi:FkbM family methyltransferase
MKIILKMIYSRLYRALIDYRLIRTKKFIVNGKRVTFHSIYKNNLLKGISIFGFESHENEVIKLVKKYSWSLDFFYDIGSNVGHYSVIASCYHKKTNVVAVEPFELNAQYIKKLKDNNKMNFSVVQRAVDSISNEEKTFYFPISKKSSKLPGTGTLINTFKGSGGVFDSLPFETSKVKTISLDDLTKDCHGSALIKMDCEGNEFNILNSSSLLGRNNVDFIIEIMINDPDKSEVFNLMKKYGYTGFLITNAGLVREERPLTLPKPDRNNRTLWRNHFFTKKPVSEIQKFSIKNYGYWI